jgi:hypothetical protein
MIPGFLQELIELTEPPACLHYEILEKLVAEDWLHSAKKEKRRLILPEYPLAEVFRVLQRVFPWILSQITGSKVAASITSGAASNAAISLSAALSGLLRPCSQFCSLFSSMPRTAANSRCDRPCRARTPATRSASVRRSRYTRTSQSSKRAPAERVWTGPLYVKIPQ